MDVDRIVARINQEGDTMRYRVSKWEREPYPWVFEPVDPEAPGDYGSLSAHADALWAANVLAANNGEWPSPIPDRPSYQFHVRPSSTREAV